MEIIKILARSWW